MLMYITIEGRREEEVIDACLWVLCIGPHQYYCPEVWTLSLETHALH